MTPVGNGTHEFYKSRKKLATPLNRRSTGSIKREKRSAVAFTVRGFRAVTE